MYDSVDALLAPKLSYLHFNDGDAGSRISTGSRPEAQVSVNKSVSNAENLGEPSNSRLDSIKSNDNLEERNKTKQPPVYENIEYHSQNSAQSYQPYYHSFDGRSYSREVPSNPISGDKLSSTYKVNFLIF